MFIKLTLIILLFFHFNLFSQERESKSPTKAMLFSIIPGGGQVYNEDYWKAPIMFAGAGIMFGSAIYYQGLINDVDNLLKNEEENTANSDLLKRRREFYIDNRDQFYFYFGAIYIISLLDAYTGAHLYNFDIDENLSMNFGVINNNKVGIGIKYRIN